MERYQKRKGYIHINRYQRPIILITLIPLFILCAVISIYVFYLKKEVVNLILFTTDPPSIRTINIWGAWILASLWIFFTATSWTVYKISSRYLGPFERILREMDAILAGNGRTVIRARKGDNLANDLLARINQILKRLPQHDPAAGTDHS